MGRKPNPIIAAHFIRGKKHGQTTNRYAQTCSHCEHLFPTGRPETLFAHLANCPGLTQPERSEVINQLYSTLAVQSSTSTDPSTDPLHDVNTLVHNNDFDITGLNVLAGAAENAEDLAIDPQIAGNDLETHTSASEVHPLPFYDNHYVHTFHNATSQSAWPFPLPALHDTVSPFADVQSVTTASSSFSLPALPTTQWSFEPVVTSHSNYVPHSEQQMAISFAENIEQHLTRNGEAAATSGSTSARIRPRKSREPYSEPKRARIAEMRLVGACIRCSRLRKPCELERPCQACSKTASKTWLGGCTSLNKGQEFNFWLDDHFSSRCATQLALATEGCDRLIDFDGRLNLAFLGEDGPTVSFDLTYVELLDTAEEMISVSGETRSASVLINRREDLMRKLTTFAIDHQEILIESVGNPALYTTVRFVKGLSLTQELRDDNVIWGSGKQSDQQLAWILNLWLTIVLLTNEEYGRDMRIIGASGKTDEPDLLRRSTSTIMSQIDAVIEAVILTNRDSLRRFDADILNQSQRHLFNLAVGMFLLLDIVERYCCFMKRRNLVEVECEPMLGQAQTLAYKYKYCIQNIQMIPTIFFNDQHMMAGETTNGKIDHELQRYWIANLSISEDDLKLSMAAGGDDEWLTPRGRLWARLFSSFAA